MHDYCGFAFNISLFFLSPSPHFFFFSLFGTSHSHLTLAVPLISTALSPQPCHRRSPHSLKLSLIIEALVDCRCTRWSLLLSFFFVWWFWDFDQWVLMILISGFGILMGGLMMVVGWVDDCHWFFIFYLIFFIYGFDDFDKWVLMILISGFGILMGGWMVVGVPCGLIVYGG